MWTLQFDWLLEHMEIFFNSLFVNIRKNSIFPGLINEHQQSGTGN